MPMQANYARYGLQANPFDYTLDPLKTPADFGRFARIAGFQRLLDSVDAQLEACVAAGKPAFLLLCGGSGSGRSAVARYALAKYRTLRGLPPERFILPDVKPNHSVNDVFGNWMIELGSLVKFAKVEIGESLAKEISAPAIGEVKEHVLIATCTDLTSRVSMAMKDTLPSAGFGVLLKGIQTLDLFWNAIKVFKRAQTVVVLTALNSLADELKGDDAEFRFQLPPLSGADVPAVINKRWSDFAQTECPFEETGLSSAFVESQPIEKVLQLIGQVLDSRLIAFPQGEPWPQAPELRLDREYIVGQVGILSRNWRAVV
jgi:hypothetical protein